LQLKETLKNINSPEFTLKFRLLLGYTQWCLGKIQESFNNYSFVLERATQEFNEEYQADALVGLGMVENSKGSLDAAAKHLMKAISIYQKLKNYSKEAQARNRYGINLSFLGRIQEGTESLEKAINLAQKAVDLQKEASARNNLALFEMNQGDIQKAANQFLQCVEISRKMENQRDLAIMLSNYAETQQHLGNYKLAEQNYLEALQIAEKARNILNIATIKADIGGFYTEIRSLKKAKKFLEEAMALFTKVEMKFNFLQCLNYYARYWLASGNYLKSIEYLQQALNIVENTQLNFPKIQVLITMVQTHFALHNVDTAYTLLKEIMKLAWKQQNKVALGLALIERTRLSLSFSNFHEAELLLMEAKEIGKITNHFEIIVNSRLLLALTFLVKNEQHRYSQEIKLIANLVNEILKLTKERALWPRYVDTLLVRASLYVFEGYDIEAQKILNNAEELVKTNKLLNKTHQINRIRQLIKRLEAYPLDRDFILSQINNLLSQEIQRITTQGMYLQISQEDVDKIFVLSYKIDEKRGTILYLSENIDPEIPELRNHIQMAGNIYMVSLGQGHGYHEGLFGPFPFADGKYRALVHSLFIKDSQMQNKRLNGATFFITCLIYPQKLSPLLNNREKLEKIFSEHFRQILDIRHISVQVLKKLRTSISEFFLKPFIVD